MTPARIRTSPPAWWAPLLPDHRCDSMPQAPNLLQTRSHSVDDPRMLTQTLPRLCRGLSLVTALAVSWSSIALAAPAVIKRSTEAHGAPFAVAPPVGFVAAGTKLSADETATTGWRRVQLPNGRFAFIHDEDVEVDLSHAAPPPKFAGAATAAPAAPGAAQTDTATPASAPPVEPLTAPPSGGHGPLYVSDFAHLAELVRSDPKSFDLASTFDTEQAASSASIWGGVFGGLLLWVLADTALKKSTCVSGACADSTNATVHNVGTVMLVLGPLIGWAVRPTRADQTKVIDEWNSRHPDRPFIDRAGVETPQ
jgi:hypothetical protein